MGILTGPDIQSLSQSDALISPFDPALLQGASYDARLGADFRRGGQVSTLTAHDPYLSLHPGEFCILSSLERIVLPANVVGHNGIMSRWTQRGLLCLFSPQIDPGFSGYIFVPVFNAGDSDIAIQYEEPIFTLEFTLLDKPAPYLWSSRNKQPTLARLPIGPSGLKMNFQDIKSIDNTIKKIEEINFQIAGRVDYFEKRLVENTQYRAIILTNIIAIIGLIFVVVGIAAAFIPVMSTMRDYQSKIDDLQSQLKQKVNAENESKNKSKSSIKKDAPKN